MIDRNEKLDISDAEATMSQFLKDKFSILLRDLNDEKYKPVKLKNVNWDNLVAHPGHWRGYVLKAPQKK